MIERDFGVMTGELTSSIKEKCAPDIIETDTITYFLSPEGAETFEDLVARGRAFIDKTKFNYGEKNVLAVCHGDIGKMIYAAASGKPWRDVLLEFHFGNGELIDVSSKDAHIVSLEQYNH